MKELIGGVLILLVIAVTTVITGYVFSSLWGWFVAPKFDVPTLSIAEAAGLALTIGFVTHQTPAKSPEGTPVKDKMMDLATVVIIKPIVFLLIGICIVVLT